MTIRTMLVDDHEVFRIGLRAVIEAQDDMCVVAEAGSGEEALELLSDTAVDVLVLDIGMAGMSGLEVASRVSAETPDIAVVMLSLHSDDGHVQAALRNGALGYVLKEDGPECVVQAIRTVASGKRYLCTGLSQRAIDAYLDGKAKPRADAPDGLTPREAEVIAFVAQGHTSAEIANMFSLSRRTIETHRANAMQKLGLKNEAQVVHYALRSGLLSVDDLPAD